MSEKNELTFEEKVNNATLRFNAAEPLSLEDVLLIAKVDTGVWTVKNFKINTWHIGRKAKTVDLEYLDGVASGTVVDTGEIKKEYLYQVTVELERIQPIPSGPVIFPISITSNTKPKNATVDGSENTRRILFVTDPHFGYREERFEKPKPFQNRGFLGDLLSIASSLVPEEIIWGGDMLDLADFSKYPTEPTIVNKTQMAGIEASWVLNQFKQLCRKQTIIEGNHDVRLKKAITRNLSAAYDLRPTDDLYGPPLLSVERFLGIEGDPSMSWVGGYPASQYVCGNVIFEHGNVVRKGSGATAKAISENRMHNTIFGHIHRYERVTRNLPNSDERLVTGTPGCACSAEAMPGSGIFSNWSNGAFLITMVEDKLKLVEDITHEGGRTYFRGHVYRGQDYVSNMVGDLPHDIAGFF